MDVLWIAQTTLLQPSRKWHMGAAMPMVPTYLLYRIINVDIYSSSRAGLWNVLQPDSANSSVCNTSVSSIGRETHCCQDHRSLSNANVVVRVRLRLGAARDCRLLFWHHNITKFVSPAYNEPRTMAYSLYFFYSFFFCKQCWRIFKF